MPKNSSLSLRLDPQVKAEVEAIYARYGLSVTEAINIFLHQSRNVGGLPFDLRPARPNEITRAAMLEGDEIVKSGQGRFSGADDMLVDLKS